MIKVNNIINKSNENNKSNINIADDVILDEKQHKEINYNEYNDVATSNHWLSDDEQKVKVKEIEKVTKIKK